MSNPVDEIRRELKRNGDEKIRKANQAFFKDEVKCYGLKSALVWKICGERFKAVKNRSRPEIFDLCEEFWKSGYIEETFFACEWSYRVRKQFEPKDFKTFERWVNDYVTNWASCDTFCNHTVGAFVDKYPGFLSGLKKWAKSRNRWMRRAAAVSLIVPAKQGRFLKEVLEIADILLEDQDDMVQKGYGWMLKVAGQAHQREVFNYVMQNKSRMPRTALRYAIEKMPATLKAKAMSKPGQK